MFVPLPLLFPLLLPKFPAFPLLLPAFPLLLPAFPLLLPEFSALLELPLLFVFPEFPLPELFEFPPD